MKCTVDDPNHSWPFACCLINVMGKFEIKEVQSVNDCIQRYSLVSLANFHMLDLTQTLCLWPLKTCLIQSRTSPAAPYAFSLWIKCLWGNLSKAFCRSRYRTSMSLPASMQSIHSWRLKISQNKIHIVHLRVNVSIFLFVLHTLWGLHNAMLLIIIV